MEWLSIQYLNYKLCDILSHLFYFFLSIINEFQDKTMCYFSLPAHFVYWRKWWWRQLTKKISSLSSIDCHLVKQFVQENSILHFFIGLYISNRWFDENQYQNCLGYIRLWWWNRWSMNRWNKTEQVISNNGELNLNFILSSSENISIRVPINIGKFLCSITLTVIIINQSTELLRERRNKFYTLQAMSLRNLWISRTSINWITPPKESKIKFCN